MADRSTDPSPANVTIDWQAVRSSSRSFKFDELSTYSHCGVNPYTLELVRALCLQFNLPTRTRAELAETWAKLSLKTEENTRHILLDLVSSDHGSAALGICGALNEAFEEHSLGYVFNALAELSDVPDGLKPGDESWFELARVCTGVQLPSTFRSLVNQYLISR